MKLDEIKADHMGNIDSLEMKISATTSTKPSLSYEQPSSEPYSYSEQPYYDIRNGHS